MENFRSFTVIFLAQINRRNSSPANTNQSTESNNQIHQRKSQCQSGNCQCPYSVSYKNTINNIIYRSHRHRNNGG